MSHKSLSSFFKKNQKSKIARISLNFSSLVLGLAVFSMLWPTKSFSQTTCPSIHVKIQNIDNSTGIIACAIFESKEGFPDKFMKMGYKVMTTQIEGKEASFKFSDIKPGTYAIVVIHDENLNGELDSNLFGIPTEGYGFSSGAEVKMSAPSFSEAQFLYTGGDLKLSIPINY
ncbi:DUF2141 domain-containing protein [Psychroflexus sediminis]|uniref:Uncharacterized conserved protein, DUF2141 family n=1 Tax=Psychroflexus sediminis TaxID=470826 RepID=A0A1G7VXT8_9FLAO|nr:DUF2141 domain-containing protein [Psychroflexus sediminis]SDG64523.1 Uncharacterized conserved protein, DUF2141 family [Psychroflexus sediminis]